MNSNKMFKHDLLAQFARVAKALGHANRLELLELLAQGECTVESLAAKSGLSFANASQHLQQLRQVGLVYATKVGQRVYYRLNGDDVVELFDVLRRVGERHVADVERLITSYLTSKDSLEPIHAGELVKRSRAGLVTILDVRPGEEFKAGHLPGAINVPLDKLDEALSDLQADQEVVAYCRGPYCVLAYEAVARLRDRGFTARRLEYGYPEWKHSGWPVEISA